MSDFQKIIDHPDQDKIIGKLVSGESAAKVAEYLKVKYHQKDETHLRLSPNLLKEFIEKYLSQYDSLDKIISADKSNKLDKKLAQSILNNKTWKERLAEKEDKEIDIKAKILEILHILEIRAEQVFDQIQQDPKNFKGDYVLIKYFEMLFNAIEKADKIVNDKPDQVIEHSYTVRMVQQHSTAFQEAIRDVLREMDPEFSALFMDRLAERLEALEEPEEVGNKPLALGKIESVLSLEGSIEAEFDEITDNNSALDIQD